MSSLDDDSGMVSRSRVSRSRVRGPRAALDATGGAGGDVDGPPPLTASTARASEAAPEDTDGAPQPRRRTRRSTMGGGSSEPRAAATDQGAAAAPPDQGQGQGAEPVEVPDDARNAVAAERKSKKKERKSKKERKKSSRAADDPADTPAGEGTGGDAAPPTVEPQGQSPAEAAVAAATAAAEASADAPEVQFKGRVQRTAASDAHGSLTGVFMVTFSGQIVSAEFPFQDSLWCKYKFRYGKDWHPVSGTQEGMSQATRRSSDGRHVCVWNFPIEVTFKSTNPYGWPQIVVVVSGIDSMGRDVVRGYGSQHLPLGPGNYTRIVPTFVPVPSSTLERLSGYIIGTRAEFVEDKFVAGGTGREVTRVRSQGSVKLAVSVVTKDFTRYGFRVGGTA